MEKNRTHTVHVLETTGIVDLIEEIRLRTWARLNYTDPTQRDSHWHPIVLEEMRSKDIEQPVA